MIFPNSLARISERFVVKTAMKSQMQKSSLCRYNAQYHVLKQFLCFYICIPVQHIDFGISDILEALVRNNEPFLFSL